MSAKTEVRTPSPAMGARSSDDSILQGMFAGAFGGLLALALLKLGNPAILQKLVTQPTNIYEWILAGWPSVVGYWLLGVVAVLGIAVARWRTNVPLWLAGLPLAWLAWEAIAATQTEWPRLTGPTMEHFVTCVVCFYLGFFSLTGGKKLAFFWLALFAGFTLVMVSGFSQHFGGLEESQKYWLTYVYPKLEVIPPGYMEKMSSRRIFSTLFYPNTLAEAILLIYPAMLAVIWSLRERFTAGARGLLMGVASAGAMGCLFWSGSKGGWLLMLVIGLAGTMYFPMKRQVKVMLIYVVLVLGLAGFFVKYMGFFKKGATSVVARFDYWKAAAQTARDKPVFGSGPGTFEKSYEQRKRPESEMARMAHNDYLQQASDSGVPGFVLYTAMVVGSLTYIWRYGRLEDDWIRLAVWLGLLGWALQNFIEFGLYIPAVAWVAFGLLGWLLRQTGNQIYNRKTASYSGAA
ncbi:MAG TPA: O-antigen ligase family protein [Verrucomicrobiae bacterium]|nr:O-antigen ligase family protein [Verrucomicrobiae bacterium]